MLLILYEIKIHEGLIILTFLEAFFWIHIFNRFFLNRTRKANNFISRLIKLSSWFFVVNLPFIIVKINEISSFEMIAVLLIMYFYYLFSNEILILIMKKKKKKKEKN